MGFTINKILLVVFIFGICSCTSKSNFEYEKYENDYKTAINCLHQNYSKIFNPSTNKAAVSLFKDDIIRIKYSEEVSAGLIKVIQIIILQRQRQ